MNDLANRARNNKLSPDEIAGGTFTVTNVGTFGNVMGTPIINQPQVAILEEKSDFLSYMESRINEVEGNIDDVENTFLSMYAKPVDNSRA